MIRVSRCRCCLPLDPLLLGRRAGPPESIPLLERTLAGRERVLGPDDPATRRSRDNLAAA